MKCFYHPEMDAEIQCVDCSKYLCKICVPNKGDVLCPDCLEKVNKEIKSFDEQRKAEKTGNTRKNMLLTEAAFVAGFCFCYWFLKYNLWLSLLYSFIFCGVFWGWDVFEKVFPTVEVDPADFGIAKYYVLFGFISKLIFAFLIGWAVIIFEIFMFIKDKMKNEEAEDNAKQV
jgi:hypothetical protein